MNFKIVIENKWLLAGTPTAAGGKPTAINVPEWPAYNLTTRLTMCIDTTCEIINDRFKEELAMWRSIGRL